MKNNSTPFIMKRSRQQKVTEITALIMSFISTVFYLCIICLIISEFSIINILILIFSALILFTFLYIILTYKYIRRKRIYKKDFPENWRKILSDNVIYYISLNDVEKKRFEKRIQIFLDEKTITPIGTDIDDKIRVLAAASAIIPIFKLPEWFEYKKLSEILIYPDSFNENFETDENHNITGMVVHNTGSVILSKRALIYGFQNSKDSRNVGIHEFIHKIDEEDGVIDGISSFLMNRSMFKKWKELFEVEKEKIKNQKSVINPYAATNIAEFFCVVGEYFFEDPELLKNYNSDLYDIMKDVFKQDTISVLKDITLSPFKKRKKIGRNSPCPCGSGKKYKKCCLAKK